MQVNVNLTLENIIREELFKINEQAETNKENLFPPGPIETEPTGSNNNIDIYFPEVSVTAYKDPEVRAEYDRFIKLEKKINDLHKSAGLSDYTISLKHLIPIGKVSIKQLRKITRTARSIYNNDKKTFRSAERYLSWAKSILPSDYLIYQGQDSNFKNGVKLSDITLYDIAGIRNQTGNWVTGRKTMFAFDMMREANKRAKGSKLISTWRDSPWRDYYNEFGKWIDPNVRKLTKDEQEQLAIEWAPMIEIANAFRTNPFLGLVAVTQVAVADALILGAEIGEAAYAEIEELLKAWSTWDGFINHKTYGIRTAAYSPAGIVVESVVGALGIYGASAVAIFFSLLVIDDIIKIAQGEYGYILDLIIDLLCVFLGAKAALSKTAFASLKPAIVAFLKNGGKWTLKIIENLFESMKTLSPKLLKVISELAEGIGSIFSTAKYWIKNIIKELKVSMRQYPMFKSAFNALLKIIEVAWKTVSVSLNIWITLFKGMGEIALFILTRPAEMTMEALFKFLGRRGINIGQTWKNALKQGVVTGTGLAGIIYVTGKMHSPEEEQYIRDLENFYKGEFADDPGTMATQLEQEGKKLNINTNDVIWTVNLNRSEPVYASTDSTFAAHVDFMNPDLPPIYDISDAITDNVAMYKVRTDSLSPDFVGYTFKLYNPNFYDNSNLSEDLDWNNMYITANKKDVTSLVVDYQEK